jgi:rod shape-determining protein MreD
MTSLLPVSTTVLAMLFSTQSIQIPGYAAINPAFVLMATYHWTIYRPDLLPGVALFVIGTIQDLLCGGLVGVTPLLLLLTQAIVLRHRGYFVNRTFPFIWAGFTLLTAGAMLFLWALYSLLAAELLDSGATVFRSVLTVSLFPVASFLLRRSQRALLGVS